MNEKELAAFPKDQGKFQSFTWPFTTVCNPSPRGSNAFVQPLWVPGTYLSTDTGIGRTPIHRKIKLRNKTQEFQVYSRPCRHRRSRPRHSSRPCSCPLCCLDLGPGPSLFLGLLWNPGLGLDLTLWSSRKGI